MPFVRSLAAALFILSVPVLLITSNVRYAVNEPRLYEYGFDRYEAEARTGIPRSELDRAARELIHYFNSDQRSADIKVVKDGREAPLFNAREVRHLVDVRNLFRLVFRTQEAVLGVALGYVVLAFVAARRASLERLAAQAAAGAGLAAAVVLGLGAFALLGFDDLWTRFHLLAFSNDFWRLNPRTDHLIQMFPQGFWLDATLFIGLLTLAEAAALGIPSALYLYLHHQRQRATQPVAVRHIVQAPK